jgi:acylphosphatase
MIRRRVIVSGRVQGVWFRDACRNEARRLGVHGWVRNCEDGKVEAVFEGAPDAVNEVANWCQHGPPHAQVSTIEVFDEDPADESTFRIR